GKVRTNEKAYRHASQTCRTPAAPREHRKDYLLPSRLSKPENPVGRDSACSPRRGRAGSRNQRVIERTSESGSRNAGNRFPLGGRERRARRIEREDLLGDLRLSCLALRLGRCPFTCAWLLLRAARFTRG